MASFLLLAFGGGIIALVLWLMPAPLSIVSTVATALTTLTYLYLATRNDFGTIELEGTTIRAKHLYTGMWIERDVREIGSLTSIFNQGGQPLATAVMHSLLGRIKGMEIRFKDGRTPLKVLRSDPAMTNALELLEGICYRMSQIGEIEPFLVDYGGSPVVHTIHWRNEELAPQKTNALTVTIACLLGMALLFGLILCGIALQSQDRFLVTSVPPHEITISELIAKGPGENRHITLTEYLPGGYVYEAPSGGGAWKDVWVALFPANQQREIKVVMSSGSISDEPTLQNLLLQGKVTGVCSKTERRSWGATLGPELVKSNQGATLASAWEIEQISQPPTEASVRLAFLGAYACLGVAILLSLALFGLGRLGIR